jgi:2-hydroxychromene-2-carboxylate isomerase
MPAPIDFYFDFTSPYGYFASTRIDSLARNYGRETLWRPILLGAVFKVAGTGPLPSIPLKGEYSLHDMPRFARLLGVPFKLPSVFPMASVPPARAFYWLNDQDPIRAKEFARAVFRAYFVEDRDISKPETTIEIAAEMGIDRGQIGAAVNDDSVKERLKREVGAAIERGVFGSPFIVIDGEPFWGADRLNQVEKWLETGGW